MVLPNGFPSSALFQFKVDLEIYGDFAKSKRFFLFGHFRQEKVAVCWRGWGEKVVEIEVFLEGQSKAIQGDLLDSWIFREKHDQGIYSASTVHLQLWKSCSEGGTFLFFYISFL